MPLPKRRSKNRAKAAERKFQTIAFCAALGAVAASVGTWAEHAQQLAESRQSPPKLVSVAPLVPPQQRLVTVDVAAIEAKPALKPCSTDLAGALPAVAQVGNYLKPMFGITDIGGRNGRGGGDDHGKGLALDFMVHSSSVGNALADFVLANRDRFGVTYVIWRQRYNDGGGWSSMEDRGSPTANHMDHVHVSFRPGAQVDVSC